MIARFESVVDRIGKITSLVVCVMLSSSLSWCLEPPSIEQLEKYRRDGSLEARIAAAREIGNHRIAPELAARISKAKANISITSEKTPKRLPSIGTSKVFTLLLSFSDYPGHNDPSVIDSQLFGDGLPANFPMESLRNFYRRSSHGLLEIEGATLGWYQTAYPRSDIPETTEGREAVIREAVLHFNTEGHDFSQYDNDGDGVVDYFLVVWSGPHQGWAEFWWGYQTSYRDGSFEVDQTRLGTYSWQWEAYDFPGAFDPTVTIHETGHALGLPDYYDYDDSMGPGGGVGGLDQMDGNWGDHNCFSKWLLGWLTPEIHNAGSSQISLTPAYQETDAVVLMTGELMENPYGEYFMVEHRRREGNDATHPADGLLIWHIDARVDERGRFLYDNSYAEHKLIRLMEADGLEEIPRGGRANEGDYYRPGGVFGTDTIPSSRRHDGSPSNLLIDNISGDSSDDIIVMGLQSDLGSGCAVYCEASTVNSAWPGIAVSFEGQVTTGNCQGEPSFQWQFGDGMESTDSPVEHVYKNKGDYTWNLGSVLGDASCLQTGSIRVCDDLRCWQWLEVDPMADGRTHHAAIRLDDGRVFVVGGNTRTAEIFDPISGDWTPAETPAGFFLDARGVLLDDGRALIIGGSPPGQVNAEIYDPITGTWNSTGQLHYDRMDHSVVKMADGRVLVAGGVVIVDGEVFEMLETEIFDPASETWHDAGVIDEGMARRPGLVLLPEGKVYLTGSKKAMLFDPVSETWETANRLAFERNLHFSIVLEDGRVLLGGGFDSTYAIIQDPINGTWALAGRMNEMRYGASATMLRSGKVLVTGGIGASYDVLQSAEMFDPATMLWTAVSSMDERRYQHSANELFDGSILITGGVSDESGDYEMNDSVERLTKPRFPPRQAGGRFATP